LQAHGCDLMQGNYFSAALPEPECREVIQSGARLGDVIPVRSAEGGEAGGTAATSLSSSRQA